MNGLSSSLLPNLWRRSRQRSIRISSDWLRSSVGSSGEIGQLLDQEEGARLPDVNAERHGVVAEVGVVPVLTLRVGTSERSDDCLLHVGPLEFGWSEEFTSWMVAGACVWCVELKHEQQYGRTARLPPLSVAGRLAGSPSSPVPKEQRQVTCAQQDVYNQRRTKEQHGPLDESHRDGSHCEPVPALPAVG